MVQNTDLLIVGAGAAGLWAAVAAGRAGLRCLLLERRHRPGLKLLLCGNNRCNLSHVGSAAELQADYGEPVGSFLAPALRLLPPAALRERFAACGLPSKVINERIYPASEKADDVLHCFTDQLRDLEVPLLLNCPARKITPLAKGEGFELQCGKLTLQTRYLLLATGGVSYPKTGSVGDGQRLAAELQHRLEPFRPGLAGIEVSDAWLCPPRNTEVSIPLVRLTILRNGQPLAITEGNLLADRSAVRGSAFLDATRIIGRQQLDEYGLELDLFPEQAAPELAQMLERGWQKTKQAAATLNACGLEHFLAQGLAAKFARLFAGGSFSSELSQALKSISIQVRGIRPLKEAIVTIGGVSLADIKPESMESRLQPGLFFAGEVMDIDGPTGGYNLHAAFATAELAINTICQRLAPAAVRTKAAAAPARRPAGKSPKDKKQAWGKDFWQKRPR